MIDDDVRRLEMAVAVGDLSKRDSLARALVRGGRGDKAVHVYLELLREDPTRADFKQLYAEAGGYCPQVVEDKVLGLSVRHQNLVLDGKKVDVVVGDGFLNSGVVRSFDEWRTYVSRNKKGVSIPSARSKAALDSAMFGLVNPANGEIHPAFRNVVDHYTAIFRMHEDSWPIYGKITYGTGTRAKLEEFTLDRKIVAREFDIPILPQNHAILAREQRDLNIESQSGEVEQALTHLVGTPNEAIRAFQYFTKRRNNDFRQVGLWTPNQEQRQQRPKRALVLGNVDVGFGRFGIDCDGIVYGGPACGWRPAQKFFSSGNES